MSHLKLAGWLSEWIFVRLSGFLPLSLSLFLVPSDGAGIVEGGWFYLLSSFCFEPNWCSFVCSLQISENIGELCYPLQWPLATCGCSNQ